jgi:hypothetical protein
VKARKSRRAVGDAAKASAPGLGRWGLRPDMPTAAEREEVSHMMFWEKDMADEDLI